jgi:AhpD family alkylhydroperoxidase
MRLSALDTGHRTRARLFLRLTSKDAPDIVRMLLYRPDFFSRPLLALTTRAMRGPSYWTAGEREYLAMATAQRHRCPFCVDSHTELTRIASGGALDPADPSSPRQEVLAVRRFLDTGAPATGVPAHAVEEALRVRIVWDVVNRLANAFGFELRGDQLHSGTRALHRFGYRFPGFLLAGGTRTSFDDPVEELRHAVFAAPARTSAERRVAAAAGEGLTEPWRGYTALVRDASHEITAADLAALDAPDDEVFELTVAAAVGVVRVQCGADRVRG